MPNLRKKSLLLIIKSILNWYDIACLILRCKGNEPSSYIDMTYLPVAGFLSSHPCCGKGKPPTASFGWPAQSSSLFLVSASRFLPAFVSHFGEGETERAMAKWLQQRSMNERAGWNRAWVGFLFTGSCNPKCVCSFIHTTVLCVHEIPPLWSTMRSLVYSVTDILSNPIWSAVQLCECLAVRQNQIRCSHTDLSSSKEDD